VANGLQVRERLRGRVVSPVVPVPEAERVLQV
jgi:hypothetical protein